MTDDLRTRAEMVAKRVWPDRWDAARITYPHAALQHYRRGAFVQGALWHAAQQPTREQVARAIYQDDIEKGRVEQDFACIPDDERDWYLSNADAVLALFDGTDRIESEARP